MAIRVLCSCGRVRLFPDSFAGQETRCRKCGASLTVTGEKVVPPRLSRWPLFLGIVFLLVVPVTVGIAYYKTRQPLFTSAAEEYKDGPRESIDPKVDGPRIERVFAALASASKEGNESAFARLFHVRRMLAEIETRGGINAVGVRRDELFLEDEIYATMKDWCDQLKNGLSAWQSVNRCTYRFREGRGEAEASVVMRSADHLSRFRFWLIKEKDEWSIFDYESLETSFRMSTHNGKLLVRQSRKELSGHRLEKAEGLVEKAQNFLARSKVDECMKILDEAEPVASGTPIEVFLEMVRAEALLSLGRKEEALAKVDSALRLEKDLPHAVQFRGIVLFELRRFEECIRAQQGYMQVVGDDAHAWFWTGMSHEGLGNPEEAVKCYRKGVACDDTETFNRERLKILGKPEK